jgi:hypothetical protein
MVKVLRMQSLYSDARRLPSLQQCVMDWRRSAQVWKERWVYIQTTVCRRLQYPPRNEEPKGYRDYYVVGYRRDPACKCVDFVGCEGELFGRYLLDWDYAESIEMLKPQRRAESPSLIVFSPLPVRFPGRWTTSIDSTSCSSVCLTWFNARSDAMLNSSAPQKSTLKGSAVFVELYLRRFETMKDRTGAGSLQSITMAAAMNCYMYVPGSNTCSAVAGSCDRCRVGTWGTWGRSSASVQAQCVQAQCVPSRRIDLKTRQHQDLISDMPSK